MWPSTGRARSGGNTGNCATVLRNVGKRIEKIELCAARFERARGPVDEDPPMSIWNMKQSAMTGIISSEFFTESLILAQNERWRRV